MIYKTSRLVLTALPPNVLFPYGTHFAPPIHTPDITPEGWNVPIPDNANALTDLMDIAPKTVELLAYPMWFDVTDKDGETRRLQFAEIDTRYHTDSKAHEALGETIPVMIDPTSPMGYIPLDELKVNDDIIKALGELAAPRPYTPRTDIYNPFSAVAHVGHSVSVLDTFGHNCRCTFTPEQPDTMLMQTSEHKIGDMPLGLICKYDEKKGVFVTPVVYDPPSGRLVRPLTQDEIRDNFDALNSLRQATVQYNNILKNCIKEGNSLALEIRVDDEDRWEDSMDYDDPFDGYGDPYDKNKYRYEFSYVPRNFPLDAWAPHSPRTPEITLADGSKVEWILDFEFPDNTFLRPFTMDENVAKEPVSPEMILASNAPDWLKEKAEYAIADRDKTPDPTTKAMREVMLDRMKTSYYKTSTDSVRDAIYEFPSIQAKDGRPLVIRDCWAMNGDGTPCDSQRDIGLIQIEDKAFPLRYRIHDALPEKLVYYNQYSVPTEIARDEAIALAVTCVEEYAGKNIPPDFGNYLRCTPGFMLERHATVEEPLCADECRIYQNEVPQQSRWMTMVHPNVASDNMHSVAFAAVAIESRYSADFDNSPYVTFPDEQTAYTPPPERTYHMLVGETIVPEKIPTAALTNLAHNATSYLCDDIGKTYWDLVHIAVRSQISVTPNHNGTATVSITAYDGTMYGHKGANTEITVTLEHDDNGEAYISVPPDAIATANDRLWVEAVLHKHSDELFKGFPELETPYIDTEDR